MATKRSTSRKKALSSPQELAQARDYFKGKDRLLSPPIMRAAYSDRMAWILASMAYLAYDRFEDDEKADELLRTKLEGGGFKLIKTFNSKETDTQAFLAASDEYAVLAFRGTEMSNRQDLRTDAKAIRVSVLEGRVHGGFIRAYESVAKDVEESISGLEEIPIYITGHSLGAALATVAAQRLEHKPKFRNRIAACYTFGSPRVGNDQYEKDFKSPIYRMVNATDIVTVVPLLLMGYMHIGDVRFLGRKDGDFSRRVPIILRILLFIAAIFRLFGPWVGDHHINEYRRKLEAIAQKRNPRFGH